MFILKRLPHYNKHVILLKWFLFSGLENRGINAAASAVLIEQCLAGETTIE